MPPSDRISVGDTVLYVLPSGICRPAAVLEVYSSERVDLQVFTNCLLDGFEPPGLLWCPNAHRGEPGELDTWHPRRESVEKVLGPPMEHPTYQAMQAQETTPVVSGRFGGVPGGRGGSEKNRSEPLKTRKCPQHGKEGCVECYGDGKK